MKEAKIITQEKNPFLDREEILMDISSEVTPTFEEIKKQIGKDEKLIVIKKINTNFGKKKFLVELVIYNTIESKNKIETVPKKVRAKIAEEEKAKEEAEKKAKEEAEKKAKEEAPAAEETPKEEVKETKSESQKDDSNESKTE